MTHPEFVLSRTIPFEKALKKNFDAEGHGLGSIVSSVRELLPRELIKKLHFLARERNKVTHDGIAIDTATFAEVAEEARILLNAVSRERKATDKQKKLLAWIAKCPVDLNDRARQRLLSTVQQASADEPRRRDVAQFSRPKTKSER